MGFPDVILTSRRVLTPQGLQPAAVWIENGRISRVTKPDEVSDDFDLDDLGNLVIMPALTDTHVHINEPGRTEWEGFRTITQAAAAGGITTLMDMPLNSTPVTTSVQALEEKITAAKGQLYVECGFYGGIIPGNEDQILPMADAGVRGFKCFLIHSGIDDFPNVTEADLRKAMPILARTGLPLLVHAELCRETVPEVTVDNKRDYMNFLASRPRQWELDAIALMIDLCRETRCPVHIVHLACADAIPMIHQAKAEGLPITVETCSHYLCLSAETVPDGDTSYKCCPPIREQENADRLWQGLVDSVIDFIISDHSPCTPELKLPDEGDFMGAWGGIASVQFGLPVIWQEVQKRGYSLAQLSQWMAVSTARFAGLEHEKGRIAEGCRADLVIWDPEACWTVTTDVIYHRHKVTPYLGRTLQGRVHQTWLAGQKIFDKEETMPFVAGPIFQPLLASGNTRIEV